MTMQNRKRKGCKNEEKKIHQCEKVKKGRKKEKTEYLTALYGSPSQEPSKADPGAMISP